VCPARWCFIPVMEPPTRGPVTKYSPTVEELHLLVENLGSEIDSYRRREAAWLSLVVHGVIIAALIFAPKWTRKGPVVLPLHSPQQDATFLMAPETKPMKAPKTNIISDQDRMAQSRNPVPQPMRPPLDARLPGKPGAAPTPPVPAQQAMQPSPSQSNAQQQAASPQASQNSQTTSQMQPSGQNPFKVNSPGSSVQGAIQSVAANHGTSSGGFGGDYGTVPTRQKAARLGGMEILSDTQGVDFGAYMKRLQVVIQSRFDVEIPQVARPPIMKKGLVVLEFAILKDGTITSIRMISSAGDVSLDRGAWGTLTFGPAPQLPTQFTGDFIVLRGYFYYNPDRKDFE
jgi:outer membrane biosynthesis protein TonB